MIRRSTLLCLTAVLAACAAHAETSPYYIGVSQAFTRNSNVFNANSDAVSDTISSTTLRGGIDQPIGRQRLYANGTASANRFRDRDELNNTGYSLAAGLDWSTIERLSGSLTVNANQNLGQYNTNNGLETTERNLERSEAAALRVRYGMATRLGLEGSVGHRRVSYSAALYDAQEYRQDSASLGLTYRFSGALSMGSGVSLQKSRYPLAIPVPDESKRRDLYVTANWVPSGASSLNARVNAGKTEYDNNTSRDLSGLTGSLVWNWQPTGKLQFTTSLSRDNGQESSFNRLLDGSGSTVTDFSRVTNSFGLRANYALSAKIGLNAGVGHTSRQLSDGLGDTATDRTNNYSLGGQWAPTRALLFGCDVSRHARTGGDTLSSGYSTNVYSCFGQFTLQ